jgi:crescentin
MLSRIDRVLSRNGKGGNGALSGGSDAPAPSGDAAGIIGERFETIQDSLDQLTDMARRFGTFESLLGQLREPLEAEFKSRRDSHVELINLRAANTEIAGRLEALSAESRKLAAALAEAEARGEELSALHGEQVTGLQDAHIETDRLRSELSEVRARAEGLEAAGRSATQRIKELEQDQEAVRAQLKQAETLRTDSENGRAQARAMRALENQTDSARATIDSLSARLDTATARANGLEVLNTEQASRLSELQSTMHGLDRKAEALQITVDRGIERIRSLEGEVEESRQRLAGLEVARLAAVDRAETLSKAAATHDKAIARAEDRMLKIQAQLTSAQDSHHAEVAAMIQQTAALRAELEAARAEAAMSSAALETARRERSGRSAPVEAQGSVQAIVG